MASEISTSHRPVPKPRRKRLKPIPPPKPVALLYPEVRFRQDNENICQWKDKTDLVRPSLTADQEVPVDNNDQHTAENILLSLQDSVEALNQVLAQHTTDVDVSDSSSMDEASSNAAETGSHDDTLSESEFVTPHSSATETKLIPSNNTLILHPLCDPQENLKNIANDEICKQSTTTNASSISEPSRDSYFSVASEAEVVDTVSLIAAGIDKMPDRVALGDCPSAYPGHSSTSAVASVPSGSHQNRRTFAEVLPNVSSGEKASHKEHHQIPRNKVLSTPAPTLRRLEDCVPAEYTSSSIVLSLAAAEERPLPPQTLEDLTRSLAAMSIGPTITQTKRLAPGQNMSVSCFQGTSPCSLSGSSGVSSAGSPTTSDTPVAANSSATRIHEVPVRQITRPGGSIPRMGISSSISLQSSSNGNVALLEKLIRSHPIWFLPHLGRAACNHLLSAFPTGCFIIRASTRPASMALSLRLPLSAHSDCVDVDHFLLERIGSTVRIESSPRSFRSLPMLLEHYCKHADDLPCTLTLPDYIMKINSATELQKIALMGQDFWTSDYIRQPTDSRQQFYLNRRQVSQPIMSKSLAMSTSIPTAAVRSQRRRSPGSGAMPFTSSLSDQIQAASVIQPMSTSLMTGSLSGSSSTSGSIKLRQRKALPTASSMLKKSRSEADEFKPKEKQSSATGSVSSKSSSRSGGGSGFLRQIFSNNGQPSTSANTVANSKFYNVSDADMTQRYAIVGYTPPQASNDSAGLSLRRSFAKLRGFKTRSKSKESKDDIGCNKLSVDAIRARQDAYRRQKTDISFSSVQRLVSHRGSAHSPTRQVYHTDSNIKNDKRSKPQIIENERKPILPQKTVLDSGAMAKCVEELRQKRMTQQGSQSPLSDTTAPKSISNAFKNFDQRIENNEKPQVILRNKRTTTNIRKDNDRMSVPNLGEQNRPASGYARFGRVPDNAELQTINEGLITPVVRRKPLPVAPIKDDYTSAEYFSSNARSMEKNAKLIAPAEKTLKNPAIVPQSDFSASTNKKSSIVTASPVLIKWIDVNSELKLRQRIAKVRPTPQQTVSSMASSPPSTLSPPAKKVADFGQLTDLMENDAADNSIGSFHNNSSLLTENDDDAVSVAGTVFNEPWDSNAWENLLDLAKYSDEKPNVRLVANHFYLNSTTTIEEEDMRSASPVDDVIVSCVDSDSDDAMTSQTDNDTDQKAVDMSTSLGSISADTRKTTKQLDNNRVWAEMSNRIPSEPSSKSSTIDPRKGKSNSLLNVAMGCNSPGTLTRRAYTPGTIGTDNVLRQRSASARPPVNEPGTRIQAYVEDLAKDANTVFGATLRRFIECTIEGEENDPNNVIRNVRQFLNGIKNYLVKHGEGELHAMIEAESGHLAANEFLNIDAILEAVLHKILLVPVKNHLYHLMVKEHSRNGALQTLSENLRRVRGMSATELGFNPDTRMPDSKDLDGIKQCLRRMQNHYSPLKKLENLLRALAIVIAPNRIVNNNNNIHGDQTSRKVSLLQSGSLSGVLGSKKLPPAEELIRWLVYILAKTSSLNCEVEAWYMWELLPQQLLTTGDAAYYLTTLFSAVHILKHPESISRLGRGFPLSEEHADAFVNVAIPDEQAGSIEYHTFPAVPQMNSAKLCRVIAHQFAITNPDDYGLYILVDGYETCLLPTECPDAIRNQLLENNKPHLFAFKRHEAKIAWPKNVISAAAPSPSPKMSPSSSEHAAFQLRPARAVQPSPIHKRRQFPVTSKMV